MEDWKTYSFKEIASLSKGKYNPKKENLDLPCIELEHLESETGRLLGYTSSLLQSSTKNRFKPGDILYGKLRPYLRKYYFPNFEGVCSSEIWVLKNEKQKVYNKYLYYVIQTNRFNQNANKSSGTKMPRADWDFVSETVFPIPPFNEQYKIASILSTWDKAIELKEKLIEQKKEQKKGLMQKLLTGEVRLPGFNGEWKEVKLGYLGECIRGVSYKPGDLYPEDNRNSVRLLRSNNIKDDTLNNEDIQYVDKSKAKEKQLLRKNDLVISMANGSKKLVGKSGVFNSLYNYAYTVGAFCAIFRFNDRCSPNYAKYLFQTNKYNYYVQNLMAGSNINNLKPSDIESMKFSIPAEKNEQDGIATILDTTTKEIKYLNKEIVLLKQQKKGLMQLLLTGKVRVKV